MKNKFTGCLIGLSLLCLPSLAQDRPIGYWRSHLPYNSAISIATDGNTIFVASEVAMYDYNIVTGELNAYSKAEGMSDLRMSYIGHDILTGTTILAYENSNIDLFRDNTFYNIPDLRLKSVSGNKTVYHIYAENGLAYLSTGIGVVVVNLEKREVKETYALSQGNQSIPVYSFWAHGDHFYAATNKGLYRASQNAPNLQAQSAWQLISPGRTLNYLASAGNKLFASGRDSLFVLQGDTLQYVVSSDTATNHIDGYNDRIYLSRFKDGSGSVWVLDMSYQITDSFRAGNPRQVVALSDGSVYLADQYVGMGKVTGYDKRDNYVPTGPSWYGNFGIHAENKEVWVAHGGYNSLFQPSGNRFGLSKYRAGYWSQYNTYDYYWLQGRKDYISIARNPVDQSIWAGSLQSGIIIFKEGSGDVILDKASGLEESAPGVVPVTGIAFDKAGNAWVTQHMASHELAVYTKDGTWYHYTTPYARNLTRAAANLIIDNADQKWFTAPQGSASADVIVYNDNGTPENGADDRHIAFGGNDIPGAQVLTLAKDRNGAIWMGTDDGIAVVHCPEQVLDGSCRPETPVVQYDQFAGKLFQGEFVRAIAVDGANRKWVGTNNGVWLISPDGDHIIYRFTAANSPLPSNIIQKIAVDGVTGDVYIGTENGLISYRSTATDGGTENSNVLIFPNPVPDGYAGTVAVKGLVENADVRITDISGQLVYRTRALGGQAIWSGYDYTGNRPQTGVYLVFVTNKDGTQRHVGKIVFVH